jgi:flagella synthesis protein FlgN
LTQSATPSPSDHLIEQQLTEEIAELHRFLALLFIEQEILAKGEADKLPPVVEQKSVLAGRLSKLLADREHALIQAGFVIGREGMEAWLATCPASDGSQNKWLGLLELAAKARAQQEINGKLIAIQLQHNQQAIAALMSASGRPLTYGPDGQQRVGGGGRTLGSA